MKPLLLLFGILFAMIAVYYSAAKINVPIEPNMISLVNVEALASGEEDGDNWTCATSFSQEIIMQICHINGKNVNRPIRESLNYTCDGKGRGNCQRGACYTFFDCFGAVTGSNDTATLINCN